MSELKVNTISEVTGANGVVVDSVKLKDGGVIIADAGNIGSASDTDAIAIASGGGVTFSQAATFSGAITSNAGVVVDNITIDGTEIDLSSGDLTLDVAGDIILDADGGDVKINDGGTAIAELTNSSTDFVIKSVTSDKDIIFKGNDGGAAITALTLDMSAAGAATFNAGVTATTVTTSGSISAKGGLVVNEDKGNVDFRVESDDKSHLFFTDASANVCGTSLEDGTAPQHGQFHIRNSSSGQSSMPANGDELIIEGNGHMGMTILSAAANTGNIFFGDNGDNDIGSLIYNHNDNSMSLTTNAAVGLKIDSIGAVTKPLQPAFFVTKNGSQNNIPINATTTVEWQIEAFDQNGDFASHTFTAPVTGRYSFSALINWSSWDTDFGYAWHRIETSNRTIFANIGSGNQVTADGYFFASSSILCDMDANDTCKITIQFSNDGATQADIMQSSFFSGHLVC